MAQALTVGEKILYHLSMYSKAEEKYEVPFDITQDGIAQSCGISRAHAAIELKKLREVELIVEKLSHVRRAKSRRKVYFLTHEGKSKTAKIVDHVKSGAVESDVDVSRIKEGTGPAKRIKRHRSAIPQPKFFFGREKELTELRNLSEDDDIEIVLILGLGGIGKTTLLSKFARELKSSILWLPFNEWETELSLLRSLANFLEETGDNRLASYLKSDHIDLGEIGYLIGDAFSENRRIMILDDVDKAPRLHDIIKMILENIGPNRAFLSAESRPSFIDDLSVIEHSIKEIVIEGLEQSAALELLKDRNISGEDANRLCSLTSCHPLLLRLVPENDEISAKLELSNFVRKNFLGGLSARDMSLVEKCSVFRKPFYANYLSRDERNALQLPIFYQISGNFIMHEVIRKIVLDQIPARDIGEYFSRAADFYLGERNWSERLFYLVHAGRFLESEMLIHNHANELIGTESPQNLLDEIETIPPKISKYTSSVKLVSARASALIGNEKDAIDRLEKMVMNEEGEERGEAILQLSEISLDDHRKKILVADLKALLSDENLSGQFRSKAALSIATLELLEGNLEESEKIAELGLISAGNSFSLDTISSLNRLLAQIFVKRETYQEAITFLSQTALSFAGQYRPLFHRLMAKSLSNIDRMKDAERNLETGIGIAEAIGQYKELTDALLELCTVRIANDDLEGAAEACYRCIEVSSSLEDRNTLSAAYECLSSVELARGDNEEAEENREKANQLLEDRDMIFSFHSNGRGIKSFRE